jgi:hypothetical protein
MEWMSHPCYLAYLAAPQSSAPHTFDGIHYSYVQLDQPTHYLPGQHAALTRPEQGPLDHFK